MIKFNNIEVKFSFSFFLMAIAVILLGNSFVFLIYMFSVFFHEMAHAQISERFGIKMIEIKIYPFGAVLYGDIEKLTPIQSIVAAISGPLFNIIIAVCCIALWWLIPQTYAYTDIIVFSNLTLALFNLLPVYPLDGGKIFYTLLCFKLNHIKAFKIVRILGAIASLGFMTLFIVSCLNSPNYYLMIAAILLAFSALDFKNTILFKNAVSSNFTLHNLRQGVNVRHIIVSETLTLHKLIKIINPNYFYIIDVCDKDLKITKTFNHSDLEKLILTNNLNITLDKIVKR